MEHFELKHNLKVIVPVKDNDGISLENQIETLRISLAERYGGSTMYTGVHGLWMNDEHEPMNDENVIIESFSDEPIKDEIAEIIAGYVLRECRQMASSLIIDGVMRIYS